MAPKQANKADDQETEGSQRAAVDETKEKAKRKASQEQAEGSKRQKPGVATVNPKRWRELRGGEIGDGPIIYWMSRDQRARDNWALLHAAELASKNGAPVAVAFNLLREYLNAGARQFGFMLRGLQELEPRLEALNIPFFLVQGDPVETIPQLLKDTGAGALVTDLAVLRLGRQWREKVAEKIDVPFHEVDAHNVVPVWEASDKRETGARTIRNKINRQLGEYLEEYPELEKQTNWNVDHAPEPVDWDALIAEALERGKAVPEVTWRKPGEDGALEALTGEKEGFLTKARLGHYDQKRNDPNADAVSGLSAYFHFGQLAPARAALEAGKHRKNSKAAVDGFLEEMIIRRELADNFCFYEPNYDNIKCAAPWAAESLKKHTKDKREHLYSLKELEEGKTYDKLWNAAQLEMVHTGKMHGFMRMYWAKKILEWTENPEQALEFSIYLNDRYELDGRDPNGYVGCTWSVCGVHDQGWAEREIFGKIRYMNYNGCKRKFDIEAYVKKVETAIKKGAVKEKLSSGEKNTLFKYMESPPDKEQEKKGKTKK